MQGVTVAQEALDYVLARYTFKTVLDIGAGEGLHAQHFRHAGKFVVTLDDSVHWGKPDVQKPFIEYEAEDQFDLIWASHVLEHQLNPNLFLRKLFSLLRPGGVYAITVPPLRTKIVGGHVSVWNAGLLSYHLILAGFDCRDLAIKEYGYNLSVIGRKRLAVLPALSMDRGDIEKLAPYFPVPAHQGFNGNIAIANWQPAEPDPRPIAGQALSPELLTMEGLRARPPMDSTDDNLRWAAQCIAIPGPVAEFGVYKGRTLKLLAQALPDRPVFGFDSFAGLPEPWVRSATSVYPAGHFALKQMPADLPENVRLVPGFFDETVLLWKSTCRDALALLHIDADLYSAAKFVLTALNDRIVPGTVLVFDELCDWKDSGIYPGWPDGEWKALREWMAQTGRRVRFLSRAPDFSASFIVAD